MRFKKGSKVEVMNKQEALTAWRGAEIIYGNGHTYNVRYDCYPPTTSELVVERVSRKVIRPCPPPVEGVEGWVAGEVVEVFDEDSWKIATVLQVYGGDYYMVRLLGLSHELRVNKLSIRVRQSWQDDMWVVMGKGLGSFGDSKFSKLSTSNCYQRMSFQAVRANQTVKMQDKDELLAVQNDNGLQGSHIATSRALKRVLPYDSSLLKEHTGNVWKIRAIENEARRQQVVPATVLEKVDAVAYPRKNLGEKYMHASFNNRTNGYNELERGKVNGLIGCSISRGSENNDSDSDACSVGSCSVITKSPTKFSTHLVAVSCQETDSLSSNAESFHVSGEEESCSLPPQEEVAASIHRLELHAYRCTLEALYASGPLSWEKEALLTNLRISLHISNDEHLVELKNLISAGTGPKLEACNPCFQRSSDDAGLCRLSFGINNGGIYYPTDKTIHGQPMILSFNLILLYFISGQPQSVNMSFAKDKEMQQVMTQCCNAKFKEFLSFSSASLSSYFVFYNISDGYSSYLSPSRHIRGGGSGVECAPSMSDALNYIHSEFGTNSEKHVNFIILWNS